MKTIAEYEFRAIRNGRKFIVQQSAFSIADAKKRIMRKVKNIEIGKTLKKLSYPHNEGGRKIK